MLIEGKSRVRCSDELRRPGELLITPATYGPRGRGAQITFTIVESPLGLVLVAGTPKGICEVSLGDSDSYLEAELSGDYPEAEIRRDDIAIGRWAKAAVDYIAGRTSAVDLPLDIRATPFQLRIWKELCAIPCGTTRSYLEIARRVGHPKAARAVGHAIGSNPISVLVPCHRAVRTSGALGGYRWGLERKRMLLAQERARSIATPAIGAQMADKSS